MAEIKEQVVTAPKLIDKKKYGKLTYFKFSNGKSYWKYGSRYLSKDSILKNSDGSYVRLNSDGTSTILYKDGKFASGVSKQDQLAMKQGKVKRSNGFWDWDTNSNLFWQELNNLNSQIKENKKHDIIYQGKIARQNQIEKINSIEKKENLQKESSKLFNKISNGDATDADILKYLKTTDELEKINTDEGNQILTEVNTVKNIINSPHKIIDKIYKTNPNLRHAINLGLYALAPVTYGATLAPAHAMSAAEIAMATDNMINEGVNFNNSLDVASSALPALKILKPGLPLINFGTTAATSLQNSKIGYSAGYNIGSYLGLSEDSKQTLGTIGSLYGFGTGSVLNNGIKLSAQSAFRSLPETYMLTQYAMPWTEKGVDYLIDKNNWFNPLLKYTLFGAYTGASNIGKDIIGKGLVRLSNSTIGNNYLFNRAIDKTLNSNYSPLMGSVALQPLQMVTGRLDRQYLSDMGSHLSRTVGTGALGGVVMASGDQFIDNDTWNNTKFILSNSLANNIYNSIGRTIIKKGKGTSNGFETITNVLDKKNNTEYNGVERLTGVRTNLQDHINENTNNAIGVVDITNAFQPTNPVRLGQRILITPQSKLSDIYRSIFALNPGALGRYGYGISVNNFQLPSISLDINKARLFNGNSWVPLFISNNNGKTFEYNKNNQYYMSARGDYNFSQGVDIAKALQHNEHLANYYKQLIQEGNSEKQAVKLTKNELKKLETEDPSNGTAQNVAGHLFLIIDPGDARIAIASSDTWGYKDSALRYGDKQNLNLQTLAGLYLESTGKPTITNVIGYGDEVVGFMRVNKGKDLSYISLTPVTREYAATNPYLYSTKVPKIVLPTNYAYIPKFIFPRKAVQTYIDNRNIKSKELAPDKTEIRHKNIAAQNLKIEKMELAKETL